MSATAASDEFLAGLTDLQRAAVLHVDGPLLVLAGPGSGKTRVITHRIAYLLNLGIPAWSILALTFTNKAAGEMRQRIEKMLSGTAHDPARLTISTFHTFCARMLRRYAQHAGISPRFTIYDSADQRDAIKQALAESSLSADNWAPAAIASVISGAKNKLEGAGEYAASAHDFRAKTYAKVFRAYERILKTAEALDFDDLLLRMARLLKDSEPVRRELQQRFQYILIDEYQDTNQAQFMIAHTLASAPGSGNICVVGDPDQCLPSGSMITTPAGLRPIQDIHEGDRITSASGWGATTEFAVEKTFKRRYQGPLVRIATKSGLMVRGTPNHISFARLEAQPSLRYTYLMWKRGMGYRIGITRGVRASKDGVIVSGVQVRTNQEVADAVWILRATRSSAEARFFEQLYSVRFGIPTMVFFVRGRRMDMEQSWIDRLYKDMDTEAGAARLMADLHLDRRFPHHRPGAVVRNGLARRHVMFTMFGDNRPHVIRPWHEHRIQLVTTDDALREKAKAEGFPVRDGMRGTWRIETSRKEYESGMELAQAVSRLDPAMEIIPRARLTRGKAFAFMPFSHITPGMVMASCCDGRMIEDEVASVEWENYDGWVYDLSVANSKNYIADGVVVHNSIYAWRGADLRNILQFEQHYPQAKIIPLGQNFRSTGHIVSAADALIRNNRRRKHKALHTELGDGEKVTVLQCRDEHHEARLVAAEFKRGHEGGIAWKDMAVAYRVNALSRVMEDRLRDEQIPYVIARGTAFYDRKEIKDALAYLRVAANPADDVALRRIVNTPARGISKVTLDRIEVFAINQQMQLFEALDAVERIGDMNTKAVGSVRKFVQMVNGWRTVGSGPGAGAGVTLAGLVARVVKESGLEAMYNQSKTDEDAQRVENLGELVSAAAEFSPPAPDAEDADGGAAAAGGGVLDALRSFLESVALVSDADVIDPANGAVTLLTLHAAKGLEFEIVAMIGLEEGLLPHSRAREGEADLEEERRLCFVGMTRAKRVLLMSRAAYRTIRGLREMTMESQFLGELPEKAVKRRDESDSEFEDAFEHEQEQDWGHTDGNEPPAIESFPVGCLVRHPRFGLGRVESVGREGRGTRARVAFTTGGTKTLILEYANLQRVK